MRKVPLGPDVEAKVIARGTPGFSGADLDNLANEEALLAARANKRVVTMADLESAKDKEMMGAERRSMVVREGDQEMTAIHERSEERREGKGGAGTGRTRWGEVQLK